MTLLGIMLVLVFAAAVGLILLRIFSAPPEHREPVNGVLQDCPQSPNCVSTQAQDDTHRIAPLVVDGPPEDAMARLKQALASMPRIRIVQEDALYLRAEATSLLFRFVDDMEFIVEDSSGVIHARSASRVGYSDMGANRKRIEQIRKAL